MKIILPAWKTRWFEAIDNHGRGPGWIHQEAPMATMLVDGVEHICAAYNDDNGSGFTLCEARIGPQDIGPRDEGKVTCEKCIEILADNEKRFKADDAAKIVEGHHKDYVDKASDLINDALGYISIKDHGRAIERLKQAMVKLEAAEVVQRILKDIPKKI